MDLLMIIGSILFIGVAGAVVQFSESYQFQSKNLMQEKAQYTSISELDPPTSNKDKNKSFFYYFFKVFVMFFKFIAIITIFFLILLFAGYISKLTMNYIYMRIKLFQLFGIINLKSIKDLAI